MTDRELMQQALEALATAEAGLADIGDADREPGDDVAWCEARAAQALAAPRKAITALKERLAQPEQEPIAWVTGWHDGHCVIRAADPALILPIGAALYTTPPQRTWIGLTDEERNNLWREVVGWGDPSHDDEDLMKAIEAKLKEKNT